MEYIPPQKNDVSLAQSRSDDTMDALDFLPDAGAMLTIPECLRADLLYRMRRLLKGIAGDAEACHHAFYKIKSLKSLQLNSDQETLIENHVYEIHNSLEQIVLGCANDPEYDWRNFSRILILSEDFLRKQLNEQQTIVYQNMEMSDFDLEYLIPEKLYREYLKMDT